MKKQIPKFKSETGEYSFWQEHNSEGDVDWSEAVRVTLPKLKPSTKTI